MLLLNVKIYIVRAIILYIWAIPIKPDMKIQYFHQTDIESLEKQLLDCQSDDSIKGVMILACEANNYNDEKIESVLKAMDIPVFGGIFPSLIMNYEKIDTGFIIAGFEVKPIVNLIENISSPETNFDEILESIVPYYTESKTTFVFIDGFSERIDELFKSIFAIFGVESNFIGGGAGSLSNKQMAALISNQGILRDCAVVSGIDMHSGIGVKHGWTSISGPYKVTSSDKTIIAEIDYKPAFHVYKEVVEKHSGKIFTEDNFFEIAKGYPFGINKIGMEKTVRDPLTKGENDSLICVGEIEKGSFVDILNGNNESLIHAAGEAVKTAYRNRVEAPKKFIFFADCISRVLFLNDAFTDEIKEVMSHNTRRLPMIGALTIGEIANSGKDYLEFFNKTSVIGCF